MKVPRVIQKIVLPLVTIACLMSCDQRTSVENKVAHVSGNQNVVNFERQGAFYDVNKDGKEDMINSIHLTTEYGKSNRSYYFWRKNKGNGEFEKPKFWYVGEECLGSHNQKIPTIYLDKEREPYMKYKSLLDSLDRENEDLFLSKK